MDFETELNCLRIGGVVAYPTETLYGLGADPRNENSIQKIFSIKKRDQGKPISLILSSKENLLDWVSEIPEIAADLISSHWPGALTLVFRARSLVSPLLTAGTGKIGVRVSPHPIAQKLALGLGGAITATSANLSGNDSLTRINDVKAELGKSVDHIIDDGDLSDSLGSTVVDVSDNQIRILRQGEIRL